MSDSIYSKLRAYLSTQPINKAWVFGSFSRGEETAESDLDLLVQFTPGAIVGLFKYSRMIRELSELVNCPVDLVEEGSLLPFAIDSVERDKILIYERKTA